MDGGGSAIVAGAETERELKVCHVVLSLDVGGLERLVLEMVRVARQRGQQTAVVCIERPGALANEVRTLGVPVHSADKPPGLKLRVIRQLMALFRELKPDVIHTHQIGALFYSGPPARRLGIPVIVHTEHGIHYGGRRWTRWLARFASRHADRFFCVSADIAANVVRHRIVAERKVAVMANGIDTERFADASGAATTRAELGISPTAPVVGTVGRATEVKRQDVLLRGFAGLRREIPAARLILVGDGPLLGDLKELARTLEFGDSVYFAGYQASPERFLQAMDVFALTSRSEGMPLSILEAWAAGKPVVGSRVGGLPELIDEGRTGILFESGNVDELKQVLVRLVTDAALAKRLGENGRAEVRAKYDLRVMVDNYEQAYRALLAARGVHA